MVTVLLIRHAQTRDIGVRLSGREPAVTLSEDGRSQARVLSHTLCGLGIDRLYSSPLARATETADAIALRTRRDVEVSPSLNEIDFGEWTGRRFDELAEVDGWRVFNTCPERTHIPRGESIADVATRGIRALDAFAALPDGGTIAAVTHGDVIRLALAALLSMPLGAFRRLEIAPASITAVRLGGSEPVLVALNLPPDGCLTKELFT